LNLKRDLPVVIFIIAVGLIGWLFAEPQLNISGSVPGFGQSSGGGGDNYPPPPPLDEDGNTGGGSAPDLSIGQGSNGAGSLEPNCCSSLQSDIDDDNAPGGFGSVVISNTNSGEDASDEPADSTSQNQ
jgi:hypothetical protein